METLTEGATNLSVSLKPVIDALTGSIAPTDLLTVLASIIGVGMGFVLMWFGVRKLVRIFMGALKNGNIRV